MATNKKNYPNDYYAWYNDDERFAVVEKVTSTDGSSVHHDAYDSIQSTEGMLTGTMTNMVTDGSAVTVTCSAAHSLTATTDKVTISGTRHYDGNYTVASTPTTTTFTFASTALGATADTINDLDVASETKVATATTAAAHGYSVGDVVYIDVDNNSYDEQVTIVSVPNSTRFTYIASLGTVSDLSGTVGDTGSFHSQVIDGIRVSYHSKYTDVSAQTNDLQSDAGLDSGMHQHILCYVRARLFEDMGDLQKAQYYRQMFEQGIKQYPMRKSGVRVLSVPKL